MWDTQNRLLFQLQRQCVDKTTSEHDPGDRLGGNVGQFGKMETKDESWNYINNHTFEKKKISTEDERPF